MYEKNVSFDYYNTNMNVRSTAYNITFLSPKANK